MAVPGAHSALCVPPQQRLCPPTLLVFGSAVGPGAQASLGMRGPSAGLPVALHSQASAHQVCILGPWDDISLLDVGV